MNSFKQTIRVEDVRPSEVNPREDMGDLDRLAESIKATGGQPVNPICVVRDGDKWRLVDGERRYRAMCKLGTAECDAMVFASYADADEAVAMLATDDKKQLSEEEAARGFQRMLDLGVDDFTIAGVMHRDAEKVKRVRRIAKDAPEQATLDAMFEAADDEFDDNERKSILESYCPSARASEIKRRHKTERHHAALREVLPDSIEYRPGIRPWNPEKEGLLFLETVRNLKDAKSFAEKHEGEGDLVAYKEGSNYSIYSFIGEEEMDAMAAQESKQKRMLEEHAEKYDKAFHEVMDYLLHPWTCSPEGMLPPRVTSFEKKVKEHRAWVDQGNFEKFASDYCDSYVNCRPSMAEAIGLIWVSYDRSGLYNTWDASHDRHASRDFAELVDMATKDGMSPSDNVKEIYDMAHEFMAEKED